MTTYIYTRVSTQEQADSGLGLADQRVHCEAYCQLYGLTAPVLVTDAGLSASTLDRPGLQSILGTIAKGDALVVLKLDRLTRSVRDLCDTLAASSRDGWALHSVRERLDTSSATGRFFVTILGAIAQWERETIGERTRDAMARMTTHKGRPPKGTILIGGKPVPLAECSIDMLTEVAAGIRSRVAGCDTAKGEKLMARLARVEEVIRERNA
jgi:DNA invertase Pin-like site-specific DNA recombinase